MLGIDLIDIVPSIHKALGSVPKTTSDTEVKAEAIEVQGHLQLHTNVKVNLECMIFSLKKNLFN